MTSAQFDQPDGLHFILIGREVMPCDLMTWARWFEVASRTPGGRHVADDTVGNLRVSTVFLGLNHSFLDDGRPLLFETMVFALEDGRGAEAEGFDMQRYSTYDEAEAGHAATLSAVRAANRGAPRAGGKP